MQSFENTQWRNLRVHLKMHSGEKTNAGVDSNSSDNDEGIAWDKASGEATPSSMQQQKTPCMQSLLFIWYPPDVHRGLIKTHNAPSIRGHCFVRSMKNNLVDKVKLNFLRDI